MSLVRCNFSDFPCAQTLTFLFFCSDDVNDGPEDEDEAVDFDGLGTKIKSMWANRKVNLDHDYAITAWILSVMPEVRKDVDARISGEHREAVERVIERLHLPPCPNKSVDIQKMTPSDIVDKFWDEYKDFSQKLGCFSKPGKWLTRDVMLGLSHRWHEKYSEPYTMVLGMVACRTTSKHLGIGSAERSWGDVKHIKSGKRINLGSDKLEKRAILYSSARIQEARIMQIEMEKVNTPTFSQMFSDDDIK